MPKILIADDEPYSLRLIDMTVRKSGSGTILCRDGVEAVERARAERPDAIILDVMMPRLDGLGALAQLKSDPATRDIPVIVLTAKGQSLTRDEAGETGANLYLTKPFSPTELIERLRVLLGSRDTPPADPAKGN